MFSSSRYFFGAAFVISCFFIIACENDVKKIDALLKDRTAVEEAFTIEAFLSQSGLNDENFRGGSNARNVLLSSSIPTSNVVYCFSFA